MVERRRVVALLRWTYAVFLTGVLVVLALSRSGEAAGRKGAKTPLIYCTDLFHPPDDPDDWFDLATVFAMDEFDLRGIVLDQGGKQKERSGRIPVEQMMVVTGTKGIVSVYGLPRKLKSPSDKGLDQPGEFQAGVELILSVLQKSEEKVTVIAVGSMRDVCAAFNREPELLKARVARLYVVAGHSDGGNEYNVQLDPHAYVGVMRSGLPIYWLPCFGKEPYVSRWQFRQGEVLESCSLEVQNYFAYALTKADPTKADAILSLFKPIPEEVKDRIWKMNRAMWSTAAIIDAAGRTMVKDSGRWLAARQETSRRRSAVFRFVPAKATVSETGVTRFEDIEINSSEPNVRVFRFEGTSSDYGRAMKEALATLLEGLRP